MTKTRLKIGPILVSIVVAFFIFALVFSPAVYMKSVLNGILLWGTAVLPALFPFFFFTKLLTELGIVDILATRLETITRKLYNVPGISSYVFCLSVLSGYPVGAKLVSELHQKDVLSKGAVYRTMAFTSTSGPLFVIGTVGIGMFAHKFAGLIILCAHIISALLNGLIWRKFKLQKEDYVQTSAGAKAVDISKALNDSMYNAIISILIVGGYIAIFFMVIDVLNNFHILSTISHCIEWCLGIVGLPKSIAAGIASGIIEVTRGCFDLSKSGAHIGVVIIAASALISWGGFSIHMQALTFLKKCNISIGVYFLQKLTHCVISIGVAAVLVFAFRLI